MAVHTSAAILLNPSQSKFPVQYSVKSVTVIPYVQVYPVERDWSPQKSLLREKIQYLAIAVNGLSEKLCDLVTFLEIP